MPMTPWLRERFLKHFLGMSSTSAPTSTTIRLHSGDTGSDGTSNVSYTADDPVQLWAGSWTYYANGPSNEPYMYALGPASYGWTPSAPLLVDRPWSVVDQSGNVLFCSRSDTCLANVGGLNFYIWCENIGLLPTNQHIKGSATATCDAYNSSPILSGSTSATATMPATGVSPAAASVSATATASIGSIGGAGSIAASVAVTAFAQIGTSMPATSRAWEYPLYDGEIYLAVVS